MATAGLVDAYRTTSEALRATVTRYLELSWAGLATYDDAAMAAWAADALAVVEGGQAEAGALTAGYLATGHPELEPVDLDLTTSGLRGVEGDVVWLRPAQTVWSELAGGADITLAAARGLSRALSLAETGLQLAETHTARGMLSPSTMTGYRRVPRGGRSCALCLLASTQRYHRGDLMPIHPGCHCKVDPYDDEPVGNVISPDQRDAVLDAVEAFSGRRRMTRDEYRELVVVHDHGEIGPVLGKRGDHFTGPGDIP